MPEPPKVILRLLHVDAGLLVVDKPAGLLSVPGRSAENRDCLITRLQALYPDALTVHRLDQVTSGLMMVARNAVVQRTLSQAFAERRVEKTYQAIVQGVMDADGGRIDLPLICDWPNRPRQKVDREAGKSAVTDWLVLERDALRRRTRLELKPLTGRTHQLRLHLASIGHPIVGDVLYGAVPAERVMLHAAELAFAHPDTQERLTFHSTPTF